MSGLRREGGGRAAQACTKRTIALETETTRVEREIEKKQQEFAEQVRVAESHLATHDRNVPEAPTKIGALFKQATYDREYSDFLDRRNTLTARIADAKTQSAQYGERIKAVPAVVQAVPVCVAANSFDCESLSNGARVLIR